MSQTLLAQVLCRFPRNRDQKLLVDASTADDAGIYQISRDCALVQTVDFFTPIVDDPFTFGQIAAANALSDVYAMGGKPITAMNLLAVPMDKISPRTISQILRGGASKAKEAGAAIIGGHTIKNPEPLYGLSVTGIVHPKKMLTNASARPGDLLVLSKPLGTGIATTAIKNNLASESLARRTIALMRRLNTAGGYLAERGLVRAATDVTGFGLLGHLASLCRASGVGAELRAGEIPAISREIFSLIDVGCIPGGSRANLDAAQRIVHWNGIDDRQKALLSDAQTSGGLLLCIPLRKLTDAKAVLREHRAPIIALIGRIVRSPRPHILVNP